MQTDFQHQILIGAILGGSSLVKPPKGVNYYLTMRSQNENWLKYKMAEMPLYFKNSRIHQYNNTFRCNSCCCETLTDFYHEIYDDGSRKITMDLLDRLRDIALAIWFLDGGSKTGRDRKNAYINTTKLGEEGSKIVMRYFNEIDMFCNINRDGNRLKILFTVEGTETLLKTIAYLFPSFMYYRV